MIPKGRINDRLAIKQALGSMLEEESVSKEKVRSIRGKLLDFVESHEDAFMTPSHVRMAKSIANFMINLEDDATILNKISDFSNLLTDSTQYAEELEAIVEEL